MFAKTVATAAALLGAAVFAAPVIAQPAEYGAGRQGSALFFVYDVTDDQSTLLRISNSSPNSVNVHLVRVCAGEPSRTLETLGEDTCSKVDTSITLTGNETRKIHVETDLPGPDNCDFGYVVAYAESSFFSRQPIKFNHLFGDTRLQIITDGRRQGTALAAAFECNAIGADGTFCGPQKTLIFDGVNFEVPHSMLKTSFRAGLDDTRRSIIYLVSLTATAGLQNDPTAVSWVHYSESEVPRSDSSEYVCAGSFDNSTNVLPGMKQFALLSVHGLTKLTATSGVVGWVYEQDGTAKASLKPMWNDYVIPNDDQEGAIFGPVNIWTEF